MYKGFPDYFQYFGFISADYGGDSPKSVNFHVTDLV